MKAIVRKMWLHVQMVLFPILGAAVLGLVMVICIRLGEVIHWGDAGAAIVAATFVITFTLLLNPLMDGVEEVNAQIICREWE